MRTLYRPIYGDGATAAGTHDRGHGFPTALQHRPTADGTHYPYEGWQAGVKELHWGFRPAWMKDKNKAQINARAETVFEKLMFEHSALNRRCLVLASGWYEWQKTATGKQPFAFHRKDNALFAFAGIWTRWHAEGEESRDSDTYAILTTAANPIAAPVHNRMPVILDAGACTAWLDPAESDALRLAALLTPYGHDNLDAYPVSAYVNSPQHDGRQCLEPLTQ